MSRPLRRSAGRRRSKYGAIRTAVDGITFDSVKEARRYSELRLLFKAGKICAFVVQPKFPLFAERDGATIRLGEYRADFSYVDVETKARTVEDVKGFRTPMYRWKKKHVEAQYGIRITEV